MIIPQSFKSRSKAYEFAKEWGYPRSERKFYNDCQVEPDGKTVLLSSLLACIWPDFPPFPVGDKPAEAEQRSERMQKLEEEKLELEVEKRRKENRKEDANWINRDQVYEREGALVGQLFGEVRYQNSKLEAQLTALFNIDPSRRAELMKLLEDSAFAAFRNLYETGEVDMAFEEDEE